jgi:hypothetical protein
MTVLSLRTDRCDECPSGYLDCVLAKCPRCGAVRYLDDWETYDDVEICPACDSPVRCHISMSQPFEFDHAAAHEYLEPGGPPYEWLAQFTAPASPHYMICRREAEAIAAVEETPTPQLTLF